MRRLSLLGFTVLWLLTSCDIWRISPQPVPVWTQPPTQTPGLVTATPIILQQPTFPSQLPPSLTATFLPLTATLEAIDTAVATETITVTADAPTPTSDPIQRVAVDILGCDTSIDILHSMGEVTNAYVMISNKGNVDLPDTCGLLRAQDEDRVHPDKKVCIANLAANHQVILKLTVDSAYQQDTLIQVDAMSGNVVLLRVDKPSCADINLFGGEPSGIGVIQPIQP